MFQSLLKGMGQLLAFFYDLVPNYGIGIILLTVVIRTALIPLSIKQAKVAVAMKKDQVKMAKVQPELKKLQAKYRDDRQKLYEEQMKLFKEHDVNPAGCFKMAPVMLIQMPILFGMFMVLRGCKKFFSTARDNCIGGYYLPAGSALKAVVVRNGGVFLGMQLGLSPILAYRQGGWLEALPYYIAVVVMFAVTYLQQKVLAPDMSPPPGSENDPAFRQMQSMARMMKFLPYMIVISSFSFPIGLTVYWITSSLWTVVEKSILNRRYGIGKVGAKPELAAKGALIADDVGAGVATELKGNGKVQAPKAVADGQPRQSGAANGPPRGKPKGHGARKRKKKKGKRR